MESIELKRSAYSVSIDIKSIVKNLIKFNLKELLTDSISIDSTKEEKAFHLLFKTTLKTSVELAQELAQTKIDQRADLISVSGVLENELGKVLEKEVTITQEFFTNSTQHNPAYLKEAYHFFKAYLAVLNATIPQDYEYTYYPAFRNNLSKEYQEHKEKYTVLKEYFENPVSAENKKQDNLFKHYQKIKKYFTQPLQDTAEETLQDLYIEPFFKIYSVNYKGGEVNKQKHFYSPKDKQITIHQFFKDYFLASKQYPDCRKNYNMVFILGQPGQGKTSFCYKLLYDILTETEGLPPKPLYFVKIRDLEAREFVNQPFDEIRKGLKIDIDEGEDSGIFVLDGLDEAMMTGGLKEEDLRNLYNRLKRLCERNENLQLVLTSRLSYIKLEDACLDDTLVLQLSELTDEQIIDYAEIFEEFYPDNKLMQSIDYIIQEEKFTHIKELLQQPVLMYFIAMADIDIEEEDSRAQIYNKIFDALAKRSWDNNRQLSYIKKELRENPDKYSRYLREYIRYIAFKVYHSPHLYITLEKLSGLPITQWFIKKCFTDDFKIENIKDITKYLLVSFYFQPVKNKESEAAIEFFHNSLWEYLTAEYMWEANKKLLLTKDEEGDYNTVTIEEYFNLLDKLTGDKNLEKEILDNLKEIIKNEKTSKKKEVFTQLEPIFYKLSEKGFLLKYNWKGEKLDSRSKTINIFKLLWTFLHESNLEVEKYIKLNKDSAFWLFNGNNDFVIVGNKLNNIKFNDGDLYCLELFGSYLKNIIINEFIISKEGRGHCYIKYFDIYLCEFINLIISNVHLIGDIRKNEFENIIFSRVSFTKNLLLEKNKFSNCKFFRVAIPNIAFFNKIKEQNEFDNDFILNHKVKQGKQEYFFKGGKREEIIYYIDYIGEDAEEIKKNLV